MTDTLKASAVSERQFLKDEIMWFKTGSRLLSPGGKNVSAQKADELEK